MSKILIINQHKGDMKELYDHLDNYIRYWFSDSWYMILVIDQIISESDMNELLRWEHDYSDRFTLVFNGTNLGLTPSRFKAFNKALNSRLFSKNDYQAVYLNSTNSRWVIDLTDRLASSILADLDGPTLTLSRYIVNEDYNSSKDFINSDSFVGKDMIPFESYIGNSSKREYGLIFPFDDFKDIYINHNLGCRYEPEEVWLWYACHNHPESNNWLSIYPRVLQEAWYNSNGMTKSFNRQFVLENKKAFLNRAKVFLNAYKDGELTLSMHFLKYLMYDYITLSDSFNPREFQGTLLEAVMKWSMDRWLYNTDYDHKLKFMEGNK